MKITLRIFAALFLFFGSVWFLQGINVLPGSFMTGQTKWAVIGGIAVVIGILLFIFSNRVRNVPG
jgi:hypothetical protein